MGRFFKNLLITLAALVAATVILFGAIATVVAVAIYSLSPKTESFKKGSVLEINMGEALVDSPQSLSLLDLRDLAFGTTSKVSTLSMLKAMEAAATDPNITAISLRMDGVERMSLASAEELRNELLAFKQTCGKPIYAYAESYSQVEYYLASVADRVILHPLGYIEWQGLAMNSLYYGALLDKVGAQVEVFRPEECTYKSAVEPFTRSSMSKQSKEQNLRLVDVLWDDVVAQVAHSRSITEPTLRSVAAEKILVEAQEALAIGMVDMVDYEDIYNDELERAGVVVESGKPQRVTLARYAAALESKEMEMDDDLLDMGGDKIAIIYIDGTIVDGRSEAENNLVGSVTVANQLREVRYDDDVKGVVLRINSPGGSASAADVMWREVELLKDEKMVIVSMGSYAASGGYYVSAPADVILADKFTLTGSIGVYGMMVDLQKALSRNLYINIDGVQSAPSADFGAVPRAITPTERAVMMRSVDQVYDSFTQKVSKGRNLPIGVVMALAGGRVWSGIEAESCGLVDGVGGLKSALNLVVDRSGLGGKEYKIVEVKGAPDEFEMLLSSLGLMMKSASTHPLLKIMKQERSQIESDLRALESSSGVMMLSPERLSF